MCRFAQHRPGDLIHPDPRRFVGEPVMVTEKLDGGNTMLHRAPSTHVCGPHAEPLPPGCSCHRAPSAGEIAEPLRQPNVHRAPVGRSIVGRSPDEAACTVPPHGVAFPPQMQHHPPLQPLTS